jgi:hypothetical protein
MMNVKDLNVKKIEDYTSFVIFFIKIIIYLFIYSRIIIVIVISRKLPLKINNSKT